MDNKTKNKLKAKLAAELRLQRKLIPEINDIKKKIIKIDKKMSISEKDME